MKLLMVRARGKLVHAKVDDDVYDWARFLKWHVDKGGYVVGARGNKNVYLHLEVAGTPPEGLLTDHDNRNKLDCQRSNLKHVSYQVNGQNRKGVQKNSKVGVRGVSKEGARYRVRVYKDGKLHNGGSWNTLEKADIKAKELRSSLGFKGS